MEILSTPIRWIGAALVFLLLLNTLLLLRSKKLNAQHATGWIIAEVILLIVLVFEPIPTFIVRLIGANNAIALAFILVFVWIILLMLDLLIRVSEISDKLRAVNEELALLREQFETLKKETGTSVEINGASESKGEK